MYEQAHAGFWAVVLIYGSALPLSTIMAVFYTAWRRWMMNRPIYKNFSRDEIIDAFIVAMNHTDDPHTAVACANELSERTWTYRELYCAMLDREYNRGEEVK